MIKNGIVGVGDICNTNDTLLMKKKILLIIILSFIISCKSDKKKEVVINNNITIYFRFHNLKATIVPHSPYSVPPALMKIIYELIDDSSDVISIHNQETKDENIMFHSKDGEIIKWLLSLGASTTIWEENS